MCYRVNPVLLCLIVDCYDVQPSLGLNCMQELGLEETLHWLDKPTKE